MLFRNTLTFAQDEHYTLVDLKQELKSILKHPHLQNSSISLSVVSVKSKEPLFRYKASKLLKVASNMKLLTTAVALTYLGSDFKFETSLFKKGQLSTDGIFTGDIILKGSGDPNISGRFYAGNISTIPEKWADAVEGIGINVLNGDIIADDTLFDREFICSSWPKNQLSNWYCAQISALSFNDNCVDVTILPGQKDGSKVSVQLNPHTDYVEVINSCKTTSVKSKHLYSLFREIGTNKIFLNGYFWKGAGKQKAWVTVDNPSLYLVSFFKDILKKRGIKVNGQVRLYDVNNESGYDEAEKLVSTFSTIKQTVDVTNSRSQNFYAEQLLKTFGACDGKQGTFLSGINIMKKLLSTLGHNSDEYFIADGSGLSKKNMLTAEIITDLLCFMHEHKSGKIFIESLAVSGTKGTLKKRLKEKLYKTKIKAKTGYIAGASSLSGYVETFKGELLAFSILVNDFNVSNRKIKKLQDSVCKVLVNYQGN